MISVLILTLNEEANLPACLESVRCSDDLVVFDSFSSDRTVEIAKAAGARVVQRKFDNYADQRNAALTEVTYRHPWVLMLDSDECLSPNLRAEIQHVLSQPDERITLYRMRRKDMFLGRWLRRSSGYPTWFGRLIRLGHVWVERAVNEEYHTDGQVGFLNEHLIHHPFRRGASYWFERHNRYSSFEALAFMQETKAGLGFSKLFSKDPVLRRKALKQLAYRLPGRSLISFSYLYFFRLGFLDGKAGLFFCALRCFYEYMIDVKVAELRRREQGLSL